MRKNKTFFLTIGFIFFVFSIPFYVFAEVDEGQKQEKLTQVERLNQDVQYLDVQISQAQKDIDRTAREISQIEKELAKTKEQITKIEQEIDGQKILITKYIETLYEREQPSILTIIFSDVSFSQMVGAIQQGEIIQRSLSQSIEMLEEKGAQVAREKQNLIDKEKTLLSKQELEKDVKEGLLATRNEKQILLLATKKELEEMYPSQEPAPVVNQGDCFSYVPTYAQKYGVDADLLTRIIKAESGGNPNAKNRNSSASGCGQFIASTWVSTLKQMGRPYVSPFDANANVEAMAFKISRGGIGAWNASKSKWAR